MISSILSQFRPRHLAMLGFCLLALVYYFLFRYDAYGIEEGAARALLINWSIVQQIANPIAFFGTPDLRAILFVPLNFHWAGSLAAAKVLTMLFLFATALMIYPWSVKRDGEETAMIATSLLLISPLCLMQADAVGSGIYLLFGFIAIHWFHNKLREIDHTVPGFYFLLLLMVALVVSIHPIGLAAPIALIIAWWRIKHHCNQRLILIGVALTTMVMVWIRWGWSGLDTPSAIPAVLSQIWLGSPLIHAPHLWVGYLLAALLLTALAMIPIWRRLDLMSGTLLLAGLIGLYHPDHAWALMVCALLYFLGTPALIRFNHYIGGKGIMGQRGLVMAGVMVIAILCMQSGKLMTHIRTDQIKSPSDALIALAAQDANNHNAPFLAASQWPGRTMLACRRDVVPLPPANDDPKKFSKNIKSLTHIIFNPSIKKNRALAQNMAALVESWETVAINSAGALAKRRITRTQPSHGAVKN
ncbi:MAG: hypothetical protein Q9M26_03485 [Mariprofundales bacterium]|nr:hypothetical protein [Mariprofundales bacterium]